MYRRSPFKDALPHVQVVIYAYPPDNFFLHQYGPRPRLGFLGLGVKPYHVNTTINSDGSFFIPAWMDIGSELTQTVWNALVIPAEAGPGLVQADNNQGGLDALAAALLGVTAVRQSVLSMAVEAPQPGVALDCNTLAIRGRVYGLDVLAEYFNASKAKPINV
jgi:hypothetical protein